MGSESRGKAERWTAGPTRGTTTPPRGGGTRKTPHPLPAYQVQVDTEAKPNTPEHFSVLSDEITERKRLEVLREMSREIFLVLNEPGELQISLQQALAIMKARTGFDAIGVRLQAGEDFP